MCHLTCFLTSSSRTLFWPVATSTTAKPTKDPLSFQACTPVPKLSRPKTIGLVLKSEGTYVTKPFFSNLFIPIPISAPADTPTPYIYIISYSSRTLFIPVPHSPTQYISSWKPTVLDPISLHPGVSFPRSHRDVLLHPPPPTCPARLGALLDKISPILPRSAFGAGAW